MSTNPYNLTDADCVIIVKKLDNDPKVDLRDWEADFVGQNLMRNRFSEKQKEVLAKLVDKHHVRFK